MFTIANGRLERAMTLSAATPQTMFNGIIFDLDGTLVDSRLDFAAIRKALRCPEDVGVLEFIDTLPQREQAAAHAVVLEYEREGAQRATWIPGAESCLEQLSVMGIPTAILTRNARVIAELTVSRLNIPVERVLAREDAAPKPAPDGLLAIAREWNMAPATIAYVGDFKYDLLAARNAGMVGVYLDMDGLNTHGYLADRVIRRFDELLIG
ncbi:MAG: HAD superfamily hydrolase (TIGR01549 family) [Alcanivorax borkumensis]